MFKTLQDLRPLDIEEATCETAQMALKNTGAYWLTAT
jgi:hypothetical protein